MKRVVAIVGSVFAVALAVLIGTRMSADALGLLVGVVCGVLASLPTSLVLVWALVRRSQAHGVEGAARYAVNGHQYPPVVVVNPGTSYGLPGYGPSLSSPGLPPPGGARSFKVVGDEETLLDHVSHVFPGFAEDWEDGHH
jgi:hypothetical protein